MQALLAFRGVVGIGLGGVPVVYTLFTEFCPTDRRGLLLVVLQVIVVVVGRPAFARHSSMLTLACWRF